MGIDLLGFSFGVEKRFRVRLDIRTFIEQVRTAGRDDGTVQELYDWLAREVVRQHGEMPPGSWERFLAALRPYVWNLRRGQIINPDDLLRADLGLTD
jgi:hypothetical protein